MFSVPLSVLSLLRAGSRLFFFALHSLDELNRLVDVPCFLRERLDGFKRRSELLVRHAVHSLVFFHVLHRLSAFRQLSLTSLLYTIYSKLSTPF